MSLRASLLVVLVLALPLAAREIEIPSPGQRGLTLEHDGFTFISNAPPLKTMEIVYAIIGLRRAIQEVVGPVHLLIPTRIYIFANARSFAPYRQAILQQKSTDTGIVVRRDFGTFIALQSDDPAGIAPFILHSITHELVDKRHPSLPLWFREGLAEYFTSYRVVARQPYLGRPVPRHVVELKREKWIPAQELMALEVRSAPYDERTREGVFYAQSWLFVDTLVKSQSRASLTRFLALADQGITDDAFSRAYDLTPEDLAREADAHFRQLGSPIRIRSLRAEMPKLEELPEPTIMARDALLFELASLLAASDPANATLAESFVNEALQVNPSHARANAVYGRLLERSGRSGAAARAYEKALRVGGGDMEVLLLCAEGVVERLAAQQEVSSADILRARTIFEKATRLDPDSPRAWMGLGATYVPTPDDPTPGIDALQKARVLDPTSQSVPFLLVELLMRDPDRLDEAIALGEASLRQATTAPEVQLRLERLMTEMSEIDREDSVLRGIQSAQEHVNADDLAEALRIIEELLPRIEDPDLLAEARKWRTEIERRLREKH